MTALPYSPENYVDDLAPVFPGPEEIERRYQLMRLSAFDGINFGFVDFVDISIMAEDLRRSLAELWTHEDPAVLRHHPTVMQMETYLERELARHVDALCPGFAERVNAMADDSRTVVFVFSRLSYKAVKVARQLRREGWRTVLVTLDRIKPDVQDFFDNAFDAAAILPKSYLLLQILLKRLRPDLFHVSASGLEYVLSRIVDDVRGDAALVSDLDDITSCRAKRGVMQDYWHPDWVDMDLAMEGYLCHRSDGVLHQWSPDVEEVLRRRHGHLAPALRMQPYPIPEFIVDTPRRASADDGILRVTWSGALLVYNANVHPEIQNMVGMPDAWRALLEQGIGVEVYADPSKPYDLESDEMLPYKALFDVSPHFVFRYGTTPEHVSEFISRCDFGMILSDLTNLPLRIDPHKNDLDMPNKIFTYFEAGLPVIVNAEFRYLAKFIEENGLGFAIHSQDFNMIGERVRAFDRVKAQANIRAWLDKNNMGVRIHDLIAFYEGCIARRAQTRQTPGRTQAV